jgi:autotransporter-associated beta strand protein
MPCQCVWFVVPDTFRAAVWNLATLGVVTLALGEFLAGRPAQAQYSWTNISSGNWNTASNWTGGGGFPNAAGVTVTLPDLGSDHTITIVSPVTVGTLTFSASSDQYTVASGGGSLTFNNNGSDATLAGFSGGLVAQTLSAAIIVAGDNNLVVNGGNSSGSPVLTVSGAISGSGGAIKVNGSGTTVFTGANAYSSATVLTSGALRANPGAGLSNNSNLQFAGGVLEGSGAATFNRSLGTGAGQVQWTGSGGFSAFNGTTTVQLNGGTGTVTWGAGGFVPAGQSLAFGSATANSLVDFQNGIDLALASGNRNVTVTGSNSTDAAYARISGVISNSGGAGGVTVGGGGTLELTANNTYTGPTIIASGALRANSGTGLPAASNLQLSAFSNSDGGVLEGLGTVTFNRSLGTGAGQVQWLGSGGFSARNGPMTVQLNGGAGTVTWGSGGFVPSGSSLNLGWYTSNNVVDFQNGINLNGADRSVNAFASYAGNGSFARISGVVGNSSGTAGLAVNPTGGNGTLELSAANTYNGATTVTAGALRANSGTGLPSASNLTLNGGTLEGLGTVTFTRTVGTGAGQVNIASGGRGGGFSAYNGVMTVQLNGNTSPVTLGTGSLAGPLYLGSLTSNNLVDFQNGLNLNGATQSITANRNPSAPAAMARISGVITNGGLDINDSNPIAPGVLQLTAANTYAGGTTVGLGTLLAGNSSGSATGTGSVTIQSNATLGGNGIITPGAGNTVTVNGTVAPGAAGSPARLTLGNGINTFGSYTWSLGALKDNGTGTAGADFDQLLVTGGNLNAHGKVTLNFLAGTTPSPAVTFWQSPHTWTIASLSGGTNTGSTDFNGIVSNAAAFSSAGSFTLGLDASRDVLLTFAPVPEPAGLLLVAGAVLAGGACLRRRAFRHPAGQPAD